MSPSFQPQNRNVDTHVWKHQAVLATTRNCDTHVWNHPDLDQNTRHTPTFWVPNIERRNKVNFWLKLQGTRTVDPFWFTISCYSLHRLFLISKVDCRDTAKFSQSKTMFKEQISWKIANKLLFSSHSFTLIGYFTDELLNLPFHFSTTVEIAFNVIN